MLQQEWLPKYHQFCWRLPIYRLREYTQLIPGNNSTLDILWFYFNTYKRYKWNLNQEWGWAEVKYIWWFSLLLDSTMSNKQEMGNTITKITETSILLDECFLNNYNKLWLFHYRRSIFHQYSIKFPQYSIIS